MKKVIIAAGTLLIFALLGYFVWQNNNSRNESNEISEKQGIADFERPEEKPNISGIVKTIVGNEITILKIERPEISNDSDGENTNAEKDESERKSGSGGGMGMGGGMGQLNAGTNDEESDERLEMLKRMSTGEEKVIILVGIKMLRSNDGKAIMATLDDIAKDQMLMIWIDETITDKNIANFVMIK